MRALRHALVVACAGVVATSAHAGLTVTVENVNPGGGFFFTPFWVAFHDGGFDSYDGGTPAAMWPGLTELAEGGDTGPISAAFAASPAGATGGVDATITAPAFAGDAPVFNPGERITFAIDPGDRTVNRWFSYASMVIPSNDLFVANGNPTAHEVFDTSGNFNGPLVIEIRAANDNGTEVNDASAGAAFSALGGASVDEKALIRDLFSDPADDRYLASFVGSQTVTGFDIDTPFGAGDLIARITIDLEPSATCPSDIDCDGAVDFEDLLRLLTDWGPCP
jgi:hypothetical protein